MKYIENNGLEELKVKLQEKAYQANAKQKEAR